MKHTKFTIYTDIGTSFGFLTGWSSSVGRCATQKFDEPRALFPHPGAMHLFPPNNKRTYQRILSQSLKFIDKMKLNNVIRQYLHGQHRIL